MVCLTMAHGPMVVFYCQQRIIKTDLFTQASFSPAHKERLFFLLIVQDRPPSPHVLGFQFLGFEPDVRPDIQQISSDNVAVNVLSVLITNIWQ